VTVKGFHAGEDLAVVSARDQDLGARADSRLEDRERAGGELMLFDLCDFVFTRQPLAPVYKNVIGIRTSTLNVASRAVLYVMLASITYWTRIGGTY
jgi:hypothetical protein